MILLSPLPSVLVPGVCQQCHADRGAACISIWIKLLHYGRQLCISSVSDLTRFDKSHHRLWNLWGLLGSPVIFGVRFEEFWVFFWIMFDISKVFFWHLKGFFLHFGLFACQICFIFFKIIFLRPFSTIILVQTWKIFHIVYINIHDDFQRVSFCQNLTENIQCSLSTWCKHDSNTTHDFENDSDATPKSNGTLAGFSSGLSYRGYIILSHFQVLYPGSNQRS